MTSAPARAAAWVPVRVRMCGIAALASATVFGAPLGAQVGHRPDRSPYEDVTVGQNLSLTAGWLNVHRDLAGVSPESGPIAIARYDVAIGGPSSFYVRYMFAPSKRDLLVPANTAATRVLSRPSITTHALDLGIDLALTGKKSFHRFVPSVAGGFGVVSDFASVDTGAYRFGTKFTISYGASLRYFMRRGPVLKLDASNYTWQYQYPDRYFVKAPDSTSVLSDTRKRSTYRGNWAVTGGVTLPLFR